jgi:carbamoyltransferase
VNYLGISAGFHDAAAAVIDSRGRIMFAAHSERYSRQRHDPALDPQLICRVQQHMCLPYELHYYERPWLKNLRRLWAGESMAPWTLRGSLAAVGDLMLPAHRWRSHSHHLSHAAGSFQTSSFCSATIVIIDAVGEWDCASIWHGWYDDLGRARYRKLWSSTYPNSVGLFYAAMTQRVGLRPLDEEYILMGMAAYGQPKHVHDLERDLLDHTSEFKRNLHLGLDPTYLAAAHDYDLAASAQVVAERLIQNVLARARQLDTSDNLVYGGGVALNCLANRLLGQYYDNIWIMPNPGDAGSSLGAAALGLGRKVHWHTAALGEVIPGDYPVDDIIQQLLTVGIVGVASGAAEFGPRALGYRSLLADPRGATIKQRVNDIKRRQQFRPFAPMILEEMVNDYFDMPKGWPTSRYMQTVAVCRSPESFPAIVHHDGTSRVQTVPADHSGPRRLLEKWYALTGCPMLLNTSLNIRGEPMVNDRADADRFQQLYSVKVCS